jgi:branched-chain amino acid transport system ATP-binding protein
MTAKSAPSTADSVSARAIAALAGVKAEPGITKPDEILVAENVNRHFGGLVAVDVDRLSVQRGSITALIGPNGAGKTTFFNVLAGFDSADAGSWRYEGHELKNTSAYKIAQLGMVRTFQLTKVLAKMTVLENMRLGAQRQLGERILAAPIPFSWSAQEEQVTERALTLLRRFNLFEKKDDFAGTMSGGQRKLLEMARALMTDPTMIMLDEPMAGVNPALTQSLLGHIKELREEGLTVLFIEHDMDAVRDISDWVVVMAQGRIIAEGPPATVMRDKAVIDAYLGAHHDEELTKSGESLTQNKKAKST